MTLGGLPPVAGSRRAPPVRRRPTYGGRVTGDDALAEELRAHVRSRLAPHEVPRRVEFLDELPRTTTGKIMRRALRED